MNMKRHGVALGIMAAGALLLTACGSDNNSGATGGTSNTTSTSAAPKVDCSGKKTLKASGSTAQKNAMDLFVAAYNTACDGADVNYTANGSGAGVTDFTGKVTDFAGSDSALNPTKGEPDKAAAACGSPAWDLPVVFGPITIVYNLKGVSDLALDASTAAKIFDGEIKTWNDPAIKALNPSATLPSTAINVVYRSDQSGTTDNFQQYLTSAGGWTKGAGKTFNGGVGSGASGNPAVATSLGQTDGGIAYVEWSFAQSSKLNIASIVTSKGGTPVKVSADSVGKAISSAAFKNPSGNDLSLDLSSIHKTTATGAYPLLLATYEIVCSKYADAATGKAVKAFLTTAINQGQAQLATNGYAPLPDSIKAKLTTAIDAIS
ncbi:phosphate transport system substrate-binding protein [Kutzneria buriramensis]|uniref:Phosphate-binding protein n=2 Tax=Kutzneria buriramensis TaxID=1045776 RepID=A0A3E0I8S2_9PSEU|nr:phosphate transport system substrate-binding protein [Kutzneria buriramensis]